MEPGGRYCFGTFNIPPESQLSTIGKNVTNFGNFAEILFKSVPKNKIK
jgi:hypothetical protein